MNHREQDLFDHEQSTESSAPVECLGMTFESDEVRRAYFLDKLKEKLPELRKRPDFPLGPDGGPAADGDILRLSDPPYYTACPNPFLDEVVEHWREQQNREWTRIDANEEPADDSDISDPIGVHSRSFAVPYHREPFAVDVSEGKTDPLYKAHGYHTKVPHLAIVPSILHYTKPGDIVLDGFCGSGMTGVAAQWCGTAPPKYRRQLEQRWQEEGREKPDWGARRVILGDLSPAATFIAANYNLPFDVDAFATAARQLLKEVDEEIGWMYETLHTDGKTKGRINYTVWSEVFSCPECAGEVVFIKEALDQETMRVRDEFPCPSCGASLTKKSLDGLAVSRYDAAIDKTIKASKRVPVLINYNVGKTRYEKKPDNPDLRLLHRIEGMPSPPELPVDRMMHAPDDVECWGDKWRAGTASFTHVHHVFLPRAAHALAAMLRRALAQPEERLRNILLFFVEQAVLGMSVLARYAPTHFSQVNQYLTGVYYVGSQIVDVPSSYILDGKLKRLGKAFKPMPSTPSAAIVTTGDCGRLPIPDSSIDYVFTDPPFGDNLAYGELNFINEAFHRVFTNFTPEAIVSRIQKKGMLEYQHLMERCFAEYCRVLKPGRWMTVVFHNSKNAVWNAIQEAMFASGFVVADVRTLDKKQGSFNQAVAGRSVKQDLVISAYKPNHGLEERFKIEAGTEEGVWDFVRTHMRQLPVFVSKAGRAEVFGERQNFLLFDRMVAFHVQRGVAVPLSAAGFYEGLAQRFSERAGMYFLPEQLAEYDRKRMTVKEDVQLQLFVKDEETAIQWLTQQLTNRPQTFQDIHPQFMKEIGGWEKHEKSLELLDLLQENFLRYDGAGEVPSQIHSYISTNFKHLRGLAKDDPSLRAAAKDRWYVADPRKAGDLEKLRDRSLLREFDEYRGSSQKKLKVFRLEAVRAGFRRAWQERDYSTIIAVARKIPENVLQEDPKLLMWFGQALTRTGNAR
ncbi:MAG: hypothetical protein JW940_33270 [Polyangiaceae bacterium]|nr:hypothetical protein [Polyangiaceae bacterium]